MPTDVTEKALESLIVRAMAGCADLLDPPHVVTESSVPFAGGTGWILGDPRHYDRTYCVDLVQLRGFLQATQPELVERLGLETDGPTRRQFLARLEKEIVSKGVVEILRKGLSHGPHHIDLFYGTPSPGNARAAERYAQNRFSVTRQLRYSTDETRRALDLCLFVNGLPVITMELKNRWTRQSYRDAIEQYKRDRDPRERLFALGRCVVHLAVDDDEVHMCTHLRGSESWFLPLNRGYDDGAGNPPNPNGVKTAYLWEELLTPASLTDILENYAQLVEEKDKKTGKKTRKQIFPRYHQLDVVRKLLADVSEHGVGKRYLIQHSAGSGKSNSIAWLAHQLVGLRKDGKPLVDSVVVVTDRRILDDQIASTIKQFKQVGSVIGVVREGRGSGSQQLRTYLDAGKKIIITTVQTFPFVLDHLETGALRGKRFAIVIDEAHSSQSGKTAAAMNQALADAEDTVNDALEKRMQSRQMLTNASYFAFTATPKNKTLEVFGEPLPPDPEGKVRHRPFHSYTMKQAIQEGFILDVLKSYTPVNSYYRLVKTVEGDPEFDTKRANKRLRKYVESHDHAIRQKAEIMVDHFHDQVIAQRKIGGKARAMVVTSGIERAIQYFHAFRDYLEERKSPYKAIVAFSGEQYGGKKVTEASLNEFPSSEIAEKVRTEPYRFLICADKFQTGYDEPLLHTMYVDKALSGIQAVQTLSRLNRAHREKHDVFILDFMNEAETIEAAFAAYYRTTLLSEESDPNKLHDLKHDLEEHQVFSEDDVDEVVRRYLDGAGRESLDPLLDRCVVFYKDELDEDAQVDFKGKAKAFVRTYDFLAAILPYQNAAWEKLSIFLHLLLPKLPSPKEEDASKGILEMVDLDSYRAEKKATMKLVLPDEDAAIGPVPTAGGGRKIEPEFDRLSNIVKSFNEMFGTNFTHEDRVGRDIEDIERSMSEHQVYMQAVRNTPHNARHTLEREIMRVVAEFARDNMELYSAFLQNEGFRRYLVDRIFERTGGAAAERKSRR